MIEAEARHRRQGVPAHDPASRVMRDDDAGATQTARDPSGFFASGRAVWQDAPHSGGHRRGGGSDDRCVAAAAPAAVHRAGGDTMSGTTPFDCPRCGVGLAMSERQGIEIDYCPQCRGVWLDRGELDKVIDRSLGASPNREMDSETRGYS